MLFCSYELPQHWCCVFLFDFRPGYVGIFDVGEAAFSLLLRRRLLVRRLNKRLCPADLATSQQTLVLALQGFDPDNELLARFFAVRDERNGASIVALGCTFDRSQIEVGKLEQLGVLPAALNLADHQDLLDFLHSEELLETIVLDSIRRELFLE